MGRSLLNYVEGLTKGDRRRDYNHPLPNHLDISLRWSLRKGVTFNPVEVAFMLGPDLKGARQSYTSKFDNVADTAGYMDCVNEMVNLLVDLGYKEFDNPTLTFEQNRTNGMKFLEELTKQEQIGLLDLCNKYFNEVYSD